MTAPRTVHGRLTAEALASGLKEQYAVLRRHGKVVVELGIAPDGRRFEVTITVTSGTASTLKSETYTHLNRARAGFEKLVRANP